MTQRHAITTVDSVKPGQMKCFEVNGQRIILACVAGEFYALQEMCSHEDFPLWYGALTDHSIECSLHGSRFDLHTGQPSAEPATQPIKTYPTEVSGDTVYVLLD